MEGKYILEIKHYITEAISMNMVEETNLNNELKKGKRPLSKVVKQTVLEEQRKTLRDIEQKVDEVLKKAYRKEEE